MISSVKDYLSSRIEARATVAKHILAENNPETKLLASEHADIGLKGMVRIGQAVYGAYSSTILSQLGLPADAQEKADEVAFFTPAVLPLDDAALAIWHWQQQLDDRASVSGVLSHLKEELSELTAAALKFNEAPEDIKARMDTSSEIADLLILTFHLFALLNLDPAQCLAQKLKVLHERDYSANPDSEGKIKHESE
jgi:hypothetical protein